MSGSEIYFSHIQWDSDFFGFQVGEITEEMPAGLMGEVLSDCKRQGYRLIYLKTDRENTLSHEFAIKNNGKLADRKITFRMSLVKQQPIKTPYIKVSNLEIPTPELLNIVLQTGMFSRFNTDTNFGREKFENLYTLWIEKSLRKELADEVMLYAKDGVLLGYSTLKINQDIGHIGLFGVDMNHRGKGIGQELLAKCVKLSMDNKCHTLEVVTQLANESACRFYQNFGFQQYKKEFIYHFWL